MKKRPRTWPNQNLILACGFFALGLLMLAWGFDRTTFSFSDATCQVGAGTQDPCVIPFRARSPEEIVTVRTLLTTRAWAPYLHHIHFFGCITEISINDTPVPLPNDELCSDGSGVAFPLGSLLSSKENRMLIRMRINPPVSQFSMRGSRMDAVILILTILLILHVLWFGIFLAGSLSGLGLLGLLKMMTNQPNKPNQPPSIILHQLSLLGIFLLGTLLRILYVSATPYSLRSYDWQGHIEYFRYVAEHLRIPPAQLSWETFQPPLTYFLGGIWLRFGSMMGRAEDLLLQDLQVGSFLLSIGVLLCCLWIGKMLFSKKPKQELLFAALAATFPGLVVVASRLTNDTTYHFFAFLFLALLLHFWKTNNRRSFLLAAVVTGLGMLTKSHALFFIPIAALCVLCKHELPWRQKWVYGLQFFGIVAVLSGWLLYLRFVIEGESSIVGNVERLDPIVLVPRGIIYFLVFNPLRILEQVFISNLSDASGRPYFFEYFFRSAHFGSFNFGAKLRELSGMILLTSLLFLPIMFYGMFVSIKELLSRRLSRVSESTSKRINESFDMPLWSTILTLLPVQMVFRWIHPHATGQDFRFSILLLVPFFYFLIRGITLLPARWQTIGTYVVLTSATLGTLFPIFLIFTS